MSFPHQHIGLVNTPFGEADIFIGRYPTGGAIAIQLIATGDYPEPLSTFSTNLVPSGARLQENEFCVKGWSENEPLVVPMLNTGLFEDTGRVEPAGFTFAPVWRVKDPMHVPPVRRSVSKTSEAA